MIQPITIVSAGICLWVLYLRARSRPQKQTKSSLQQRFKTAKVLIVALLGLMAIVYSMRGLGDKFDGQTHEPTLMERAVAFLTK
jgi:hypothetical protein